MRRPWGMPENVEEERFLTSINKPVFADASNPISSAELLRVLADGTVADHLQHHVRRAFQLVVAFTPGIK